MYKEYIVNLAKVINECSKHDSIKGKKRNKLGRFLREVIEPKDPSESPNIPYFADEIVNKINSFQQRRVGDRVVKELLKSEIPSGCGKKPESIIFMDYLQYSPDEELAFAKYCILSACWAKEHDDRSSTHTNKIKSIPSTLEGKDELKKLQRSLAKDIRSLENKYKAMCEEYQSQCTDLDLAKISNVRNQLGVMFGSVLEKNIPSFKTLIDKTRELDWNSVLLWKSNLDDLHPYLNTAVKDVSEKYSGYKNDPEAIIEEISQILSEILPDGGMEFVKPYLEQLKNENLDTDELKTHIESDLNGNVPEGYNLDDIKASGSKYLESFTKHSPIGKDDMRPLFSSMRKFIDE